MQKIKLTQEMLDSGKQFEELGFSMTKEILPYSELVAAARELVDNVLIMNPLGIVYETYVMELEICYVFLKYLTDLDTKDWSKEELWKVAGPYVDSKTNGMSSFNWETIENIYYRMKNIVKQSYECENSLSYRLSQLINSLNRQQDIDAQEMGERLIDLIDKVKEADEQPAKPVLTLFAKKENQ